MTFAKYGNLKQIRLQMLVFSFAFVSDALSFYQQNLSCAVLKDVYSAFLHSGQDLSQLRPERNTGSVNQGAAAPSHRRSQFEFITFTHTAKSRATPACQSRAMWILASISQHIVLFAGTVLFVFERGDRCQRRNAVRSSATLLYFVSHFAQKNIWKKTERFAPSIW